MSCKLTQQEYPTVKQVHTRHRLSSRRTACRGGDHVNGQAGGYPSGLVIKRATEIALPSSVEPGVMDAVRVIYEDSFPSRQRTPFDMLLATPDWLNVALFEHKPLGFSFCSEPPGANWLFLEYLAVARELSEPASQGVVLWDALIGRLLRSPRLLGVVLEIEHPDVHGLGAAEQEERYRRLHFYARHGAIALPVANYVVPEMEGEGTELMQLLYAGGRGVSPPDRTAVLDIVKMLYTFGYELPLNHRLVIGALESVGDLPHQEDRGDNANK